MDAVERSPVVTKDIAIRAVLAGACTVPKVGAKASTLSTEHLIWAEKLFTAEELAALPIPLWAMSGDGYGNGYGYGDGSDPATKILAIQKAA